jgi:hypothetical protein
VYSSASYLSLHYGGDTLLLKLSPYILYTIPVPPINPLYPLITCKFADVEEGWLSSNSTFKFTDNILDSKLGEIMFAELIQETIKSEDCAANCVHTYLLKAPRYDTHRHYSVYS